MPQASSERSERKLKPRLGGDIRRENMNDTELLDYLERMGKGTGLKWIARPSATGRGWRLHQGPNGEYDTPREAIEAAMLKYRAA